MNNKNYMMCDFVAKEFGAIAGVLYSNIEFWIEKNQANNKHFYDGKYWTYNSMKAFALLFPMFTEEQIRNSLKKMIEGKLIIKGNFNKVQYDRTCWYTIDFGKAYELQKAFGKYTKSIWEKSQMENGEIPNGNGENPEPIPYINTDINTDSGNGKLKEKEERHTPIDNSYYDIATNTYTEISNDDKKWNKFCNELCRISSKYIGGTPIEIRSIPTFNYKHNDNYKKLIELYKTCKYDILKCVELAEKDADSSNIKYRWKDFMQCLGLYAKNGYQTENKAENNSQPSHSRSYDDYIREEAERKAKAELEFKQQAEELGISEAELEEQNFNEFLQSTAFLRVNKQVEEDNTETKNINKNTSEGFDTECSYNAYNGDFKGFLRDNIDNIAPDVKTPLKRNTEANIKAMQLGIKYLNENKGSDDDKTI